MTLTAAQADQVAHLLNTRNQLMVHYTRQRVLQHADNYFIRCDGHQNVIAFVEAAKVQWYQTEVKHLTVAPEHERQGHARALIGEVEDAVRLQEGRILQCTIREGNIASRALFTSLGFLAVSKFFSPASGNNVEVLQKILSPPRGG